MKNIFKLMMLALLVVPFQGCSDDDASMPIIMGQGVDFSTPVEVTPNNIAGVWKLQKWSGSSDYTPIVYLELIRRDCKYNIYENYSSMYPRLITGTYTIDNSDYYKGTILKGKYDNASGNWNNDYIVALYANSMVLTVDGDADDVQIFVRVNEVPAEIKDAALSPVGSVE